MKTNQKLFILLAALLVLGLGAACANTSRKNSNAEEEPQSKETVLVVASSVDELKMKDGSYLPTGYFLDELAVPAQELIKAGYDIVVATPKGNVPVMDEKSNNAGLFQNDEQKWKEALNFVQTNPAMLNPITLKSAIDGGLERFSAVFVPGGHAPMEDLMQDENLGKILRYFHKEQLPTALICHGPVAALAALDNAAAYRNALISNNEAEIESLGKGWIYDGYEMTIYSNEEEYDVEDYLGAKIEFYVADAVSKAGAKVKHSAAKDMPLVVRDRELITGQNPASDHQIAEALIAALKERETK